MRLTWAAIMAAWYIPSLEHFELLTTFYDTIVYSALRRACLLPLRATSLCSPLRADNVVRDAQAPTSTSSAHHASFTGTLQRCSTSLQRPTHFHLSAATTPPFTALALLCTLAVSLAFRYTLELDPPSFLSPALPYLLPKDDDRPP